MVKLYTDGSCITTKRCGGWGAIAVENDRKIVEICGGDSDTTNNIMELLAVIRALQTVQRLKITARPHIVTDSKYVMTGIEKWISKWIENNWLTSQKKPVKNKKLWQKLYKLVMQTNAAFEWVKGHSGHPMNEEADRLANQSAQLVRS